MTVSATTIRSSSCSGASSCSSAESRYGHSSRSSTTRSSSSRSGSSRSSASRGSSARTRRKKRRSQPGIERSPSQHAVEELSDLASFFGNLMAVGGDSSIRRTRSASISRTRSSYSSSSADSSCSQTSSSGSLTETEQSTPQRRMSERHVRWKDQLHGEQPAQRAFSKEQEQEQEQVRGSLLLHTMLNMVSHNSSNEQRAQLAL